MVRFNTLACKKFLFRKGNKVSDQPPEVDPGPDPLVRPAIAPGARYAAIRKALRAASPMDNQTYLFAQMTLILCDVLDEVAGMREDIADLTGHIHELIIGTPLPKEPKR